MNPSQHQQLRIFVQLLLHWSKVHNLTAWKDAGHTVDQLAASAAATTTLLTGRQVLDLGTGGGIPGIPLAICSPDVRFTLLDSVHKKIAFVRHASRELQLTNVDTVIGRAEAHQHTYPCLVSRAFGGLAHTLALAGRLLTRGGRLVLERGTTSEQELQLCRSSYTSVEIYPLPHPACGQLLVLE